MESILKDRENKVKKVLYITFFLNILVAIIKIVVGHNHHYLSLTSSGLESLFDGTSNILGLISIYFASQPADKDHNYGHQKYENIGGLVISVLLLYSSIQIAGDVYSYFQGDYHKPIFGSIPIIAIVFSMGVSLFVSKYEKKKGEELNSIILKADSEHTFGDFIISFGVLISIFTSKLGYILPDLIFGGLISFYLFFLALKIFRQNLPDLLDASPILDLDFVSLLTEFPDVVDMHKFRARGNQNHLYVDFHLHLDEHLSLKEAHCIGTKVEEKVKIFLKSYSEILDVTVHIEPYDESHKKGKSVSQ